MGILCIYIKIQKTNCYNTQNGINTRGNDAVLEYLKKVRPFTIKLLDVENCDITVNAANEILREAKK